MKMERLSHNKIRIFLTFDDLLERGIQKDDMWKELEKVHELFSEMMEQAYNELGFDASGPLVVEVFKLPAQGMVVIVTKSGFNSDSKYHDDEDYDDIEDAFEFEVTVEQSDHITFAFKDFEDVIQAVKLLIQSNQIHDASLYSYDDLWILRMDSDQMDENIYQNLIAVLSEYGEATSVTEAVLEEYGRLIIKEDALSVLSSHF